MPETPLPEELMRVAGQHRIAEAQVKDLLSTPGADADVLAALLHLATVKYRSLDRWGAKSEYGREIQEALERGEKSP